MKFELDDQFLCDVIDHKEWGAYDHIPADELTNEQLIKILKGEDRYSSTGTKDHPEFNKLRDQLEEQGYIQCQRGWWNGDRVLKPFIFNSKKFKTGDKFPCGAAMRSHLKFMKR